MHSIYLWYF